MFTKQYQLGVYTQKYIKYNIDILKKKKLKLNKRETREN